MGDPSAKIKFGLDGRAFHSYTGGGNVGGVTKYVEHLCYVLDNELPNAEFIIYTSRPVKFTPPSKRWRVHFEERYLLKKIKPLLWLKYFAHKIIKNDELDIFWGAATILPNTNGMKQTKFITTIYDICYIYSPESMTFSHRISHKLFFSSSIRNADAVKTISFGTAKKIESHFAREVAFVIPPTVRSSLQMHANTELKKANNNYLLFVGTIEPRKNLSALLKAFNELRKMTTNKDLELWIVGATGWKTKKLYNRLLESPGVKLIGNISDEELVKLYKQAKVFVFPSIYEGFGMPVLEAVYFGATVVASDIEEIREAGNKNVIYCSPSSESLFLTLSDVLSKGSDRTSGSMNKRIHMDQSDLFVQCVNGLLEHNSHKIL